MEVKETTLSSYEKEINESLGALASKNLYFQEIPWFLERIGAHMSPKNLCAMKPSLIALGTDVPEELLYAACGQPLWALGGSLAASRWADSLVPRDTDPIHRSALGFLVSPEFNLTERALTVIPAATDNQRKLAYLLRGMSRDVATLDIPPDRHSPDAGAQYFEQLVFLSESLEDHTGERVTRRALMDAAIQMQNARKQLRSFLRQASGAEHILPASLRMAVQYSFYCADDLQEWNVRLNRLDVEIARFLARKRLPDGGKPRVLLMGSSVCFPNYKVPFLIEDVGLHIGAVADPLTLKGQIPAVQLSRLQTARALIGQIARAHYASDCSGAFVMNDALFETVRQTLERQQIEGVVYHVLKGQIEYDFEIARFEHLFEQCGVPVFRLETDYQYQDVEQLRIRMEAFREMLEQNMFSRSRAAR